MMDLSEGGLSAGGAGGEGDYMPIKKRQVRQQIS